MAKHPHYDVMMEWATDTSKVVQVMVGDDWADVRNPRWDAKHYRIKPEKKPDEELMDYAMKAGDSVLLNEQAALLRECRAALDSLIAQKPTLAGLVCGSTTLGNLRAELGKYRPQGVFGGATC